MMLSMLLISLWIAFLYWSDISRAKKVGHPVEYTLIEQSDVQPDLQPATVAYTWKKSLFKRYQKQTAIYNVPFGHHI